MKPILRFKDFDKDWKEIELSKIASEISYGMNAASKDYDGENKYIRITDIDETTNKYIHKNTVSPDGDLEEKFLVKENDILFARTGASTGKSYLYDKNDGKLYYAGFLIKANIINHNANFIFQQTKLNKYNNWVKIMSMRSGQPGINSQEYGSYKFSITSPKEENKVSNFLSLLDKKIELQSKKIEDLKLFKLSKYSLVFSKTNNKIKLSDICIIEKGKQINSDLLIEKGNYYMLNGGILPSGYLNEYNTNENTVTISEGGNSCGYVNFNKTKFWCGGHCYKIISPSVNTSYLYHLLKHNEKIIMDLRVGSGLPNIQKKDLEALKLSIHKNDEQLKIGILFDTFDKKISLETNKLTKLQELKKALTQVMFV